jgi:hypothetical protein
MRLSALRLPSYLEANFVPFIAKLGCTCIARTDAYVRPREAGAERKMHLTANSPGYLGLTLGTVSRTLAASRNDRSPASERLVLRNRSARCRLDGSAAIWSGAGEGPCKFAM